MKLGKMKIEKDDVTVIFYCDLKPHDIELFNFHLITGTPTKCTNRMSPTLTGQDSSFGDRQFIVITSEKQCRIVALPSQNCVYRLQITETDYIVRAEIVSMKGNLFEKKTFFV
jgi:hypothetical protein